MQRFIDQTTGTLIINRNIRVDRATRPQGIVFLFGPGQVQLRDMGNGWTWYIVDKVSGDAPVSNILFIFQGDTLNQINFLLSNLPVKSASWSEWSEENELAVQKYLDNKLTECLGADRDFIWGSISACYDRKGGASSIVMQYS
jgi:hypothetical protein